MQRLYILVFSGVLASLGIVRPSPAADEAAPRGISGIMREAHVKGGRPRKNTLDLKVIGGRATDEEKKQLLKLYEALAKQQPPAGSLEGWKRDTQALIDAASDSIQGKPEAAKRLTTATACASCHDKYRFGRVLATDEAVFLRTAPPEMVQVAGTNPRDGYVIVYAFKVTPVMESKRVIVEREVLIDGRKEVVKETREVPVLKQKRETVESTLSVKEPGGPPGATAYRVLYPSGKDVATEEIWKLLKPGQLVLRHADTKPPDPAYLKLLGPDALIFVPRPPDLPPAKKPPTTDASSGTALGYSPSEHGGPFAATATRPVGQWFTSIKLRFSHAIPRFTAYARRLAGRTQRGPVA
jgi:hypothetical protein